MINMTLSNLRNTANFFDIDDVATSVNGRKKEDNDILDTVIVIPLSTLTEPDTMPYRFHIVSRDKLEKNSDACIYDIRALSKTRIKEKLSKLNTDEIRTVQKCLCEIVG